MRGFSKAIITGNLTRDPELRTISTGSNVCSFSVAVNRVYRDASGNQKEDVSYIDCSAWGALGETINKWARKGSAVLVSGRLQQRRWEDKTTGQKRSAVEVVVEDFNFIGGSRENGDDSFATSSTGNAGSSSAPSASADKGNAEIIPEDVPEGEIDLNDVPF